ncbi:MAG: hypothetical protein ACTHOU_00375 [Aureliella sp.]
MRSLSRRHTCLLVGWGAASICLALLVVARAAEPPALTNANAGPAKRVVLLKNDRCLSGVVRELGDQVVIEIDDGARVSKATSDIEFIADDLAAIYQHKLARYSHLGPGENIRMARWCLAVGLNEHAAEHFLAVHREAATNSLVRQLGVELREQLLEDAAFREYLGLPPLEAPAAESEKVKMVAAGGEPRLAPLAPAVVAAFTDQVQPILINRCSQSGCHGFSASNKLKIIEPIGTARGRISEQNCRSALQFVEVDDSNMSVLLRYALAQHGIQKSPSIASQEQNLIETLQSWTTFARNPVVAAVETAAASSGAASPAVYTSRPGTVPGPAPGAGGLLPVGPDAAQLRAVPRGSTNAAPTAGGLPSRREIDELDDQVRRALGEPPLPAASPISPAIGPAGVRPAGASLPSMTGTATVQASTPARMPADPFDPDEFNRAAASKAKP